MSRWAPTLRAVKGSALTWAELDANFDDDGSAFSVYRATDQNISSDVLTKIQFATEEIDKNSDFDSTVNYRFQPAIAGYYAVSWRASCGHTGGADITRFLTVLCQNGGTVRYGRDYSGAGLASMDSNGSSLIYMNGSTDYLEVYTYATAGSPYIYGNSALTYFNGVLVGVA